VNRALSIALALALALCIQVATATAALLPAQGTVTITDNGYPFSGQTANYSQSLGTAAHVVVSNTPDLHTATFHDTAGGVILSQDSRCSGSGSATVTCVSGSQINHLRVSTGFANDSVDISGWIPGNEQLYDTEVTTGTGADQVVGSAGRDSIALDFGADTGYGGAGDDFIDGGNGPDRLYGQDGDDSLRSGTGLLDGLWLDRLDCGPGTDGVHFTPPDVTLGCEYRF
jgi:Ca2+-binding RTX toxin-like protein